MNPEMNEQDLTELRGRILANLMEVIAQLERTWALTGPTQLTVYKEKTAKYSKKAHIGGEEFRVLGATFGKRGQLIFKFAPIDASGYDIAELTEGEASKVLYGFKAWLRDALPLELQANLMEHRGIATSAKEAKKQAEMASDYDDIGFGSW